ncbi:MAG: hypothetical protein IK080_02080 [Clostridia bacterium]|nr:hypothetical protein [Clostridia bacterium]MBR4726656.1 hypothetical protein [Clostridia bacterium]
MVSALWEYAQMAIKGFPILMKMLFSEEMFNYFFYGGGWMVFFGAMAHGWHEAHYGW